MNNDMPIFVFLHDENFIQDSLLKFRDSNGRHAPQYHVGMLHGKVWETAH